MHRRAHSPPLTTMIKLTLRAIAATAHDIMNLGCAGGEAGASSSQVHVCTVVAFVMTDA